MFDEGLLKELDLINRRVERPHPSDLPKELIPLWYICLYRHHCPCENGWMLFHNKKKMRELKKTYSEIFKKYS